MLPLVNVFGVHLDLLNEVHSQQIAFCYYLHEQKYARELLEEYSTRDRHLS